MTVLVGILVALALGVGLWLVAIYNGLVRKRNLVREGWSGVDVQLKRRADLIPNLIETVKGYAGHEKGLLEQVAELRAQSLRAQAPGEKSAVEGQLSQALGKLFALAENYPDLKASQNFLDLQRALAEVEEQIQFARRYYNGAVRDLNIAVESFPANLVAAPLGFKQAEFFQLEDAAERALPKVSFS
ncbi:MAG: LemA family protein [Desulfarculus sp.]|jgi:LemA protein|nr:MAG: LemA family protein [Desulfarculus sp.]